ncbi:MAG: AbrB/MazE/SpoVT family DNA-binding domain-containing protein [Actinobacteria bacterium]|nr:AbrB/MazE/SpoVT family DNA-binding domain-containing protein [Actinomycetota bacterium]
MRTTIDRAGRIVIPRSVRARLGLNGGEAVDVVERDGRIEITFPEVAMRLERRGKGLVAVSDEPIPPLTQDMVRDALDSVRS